MGLARDLMVVLSDYHGGYRLMRRRMRGDMRDFEGISRAVRDASEATLRVTLSRLKKRGLVRNEKGRWWLTKNGKGFLARLLVRRPVLFSHHKQQREKNMIVAFDIPESRRLARNWLRANLVHLGFIMLQKSVWFGPAPLPKELIAAMQEWKILSCVKFFEAKESDIV